MSSDVVQIYSILCIFQGNFMFAFVHSLERYIVWFKKKNCTLSSYIIFLILVFTLFPRFILCIKCSGCHNNLASVFHNNNWCSQKTCARSFGCYSMRNKGIFKILAVILLFSFSFICFEFYFLLENPDKTSFSW